MCGQRRAALWCGKAAGIRAAAPVRHFTASGRGRQFIGQTGSQRRLHAAGHGQAVKDRHIIAAVTAGQQIAKGVDFGLKAGILRGRLAMRFLRCVRGGLGAGQPLVCGRQRGGGLDCLCFGRAERCGGCGSGVGKTVEGDIGQR